MTPRHVVVIGAGMTGLVTAFHLLARRDPALRVTLLEAAERAGGHARTLREGGYVVERGPNGFLETEESRELTNLLGLASRRIEAQPASRRRFIVRGGRLRRVPDSPVSLLFGDVLSARGRLRVMIEPWVRAGGAPRETVHEFARRRFGREAADVVVDAAIAGITAGDSRALELESAFPAIAALERAHGSVIRGLLRAPRRAARPRLVSFAGGVGELIEALESRLEGALVPSARVRALRRERDRWIVEIEHRDALTADAVVVAAPANAAAPLLHSIDAPLSNALAAIPFRGLAVVALAYAESAPKRPLRGYGYLIPAGEAARTLGAVWESSLFPGRAPAGHALIRVMIGGARDPGAVGESETGLIGRARGDLRSLLGITAEPERTWVARWPEAIPQYTPGHGERLVAIRAAAGLRGLTLCGTSYDGLSLGAAMASGARAAKAALDALSGNAPLPGAGIATAESDEPQGVVARAGGDR